MCQTHPNHCKSASKETNQPEAAQAAAPQAPSTGSRRRRLWELEQRAHCPVVGVCLPVPVLRRVVNKVFRGHNVDTEYELHSGAVSQCSNRTPLAEGMQRELEQRYATALRQAIRLKTSQALQTWWAESWQADLAGTLWATLTHSRCSQELERQVLGEVHMLQHKTGTAQRADARRLDQLAQDTAQLQEALSLAQNRLQQFSRDSHERLQAQQRQITQLNAALRARDVTLAQLRETVQTQTISAHATNQHQQARELAQQVQRIRALEQSLKNAEKECERRGRLIDAQTIELRSLASAESPVHAAFATPDHEVARLDNRAVLCVGGRTASVPHYRQMVESTGGRFLHHDGGEEESLAKLDNTLAAADLVICQTGCISHNAYWRIKDYCKRTGKQCLYVENPGTAGIKRALSSISNT